jgi:hypothetical protein
MRRRLALVTACALIPLLAASGIADTVATPNDRSGLAVTVSQDNAALVRDRRAVTLDKGAQVLVVEAIARATLGHTAMLSGPGIIVREQAFAMGGLDGGQLLKAAIGHEVTLVWRDAAGAEREERAKVLAAEGGPVFQIAGKVVAGEPARIVYDALPPGLRAAPAYQAVVVAEAAGRREIELAYLTAGLSWSADYVAELSVAEDKLSLSAWAGLVNDSGADLPLARVQVMAGSPNRVADQPPSRARAEKALMAAAMAEPTREALGPYHLYTLPQPVSLKDGERRQVALLPPAQLAVERRLVLDPVPTHAWRDRWADTPPQHPLAQLVFRNSLGQPLPAGVARVFQRDKDGGAVFLGEDRLPAIPAGETARLTLGQAFDVTARRVQTDFTRISAEVTEAAWEVRLANAGAAAAKVSVREQFGGDWLVVDESAKHVKDNAFAASWTVTVPAKGELVLKYRARVKG